MSDAPPDDARDDNAREAMQRIGREVNDLLPEGWGFFVMTFPYGNAPGRMNYISNGQREDILRLMKEFILKSSGSADFFTHATETDLGKAFSEAVTIQNLYATALNKQDNGTRPTFDSYTAFMNALRETGFFK